MTWQIVEQVIGFTPIASVDTTQATNIPLGTRVKAVDATYGMGEFVYVPGCTNGALGSFATMNADDWTTIALAADAIGPVGIFRSLLSSATVTFGWAQIYGKCDFGLCLTSFADNALCWCTACVGFVDDTSVAGDWVNLAKGASSSTARSAEFEIAYPYTDNASNSG